MSFASSLRSSNIGFRHDRRSSRRSSNFLHFILLVLPTTLKACLHTSKLIATSCEAVTINQFLISLLLSQVPTFTWRAILSLVLPFGSNFIRPSLEEGLTRVACHGVTPLPLPLLWDVSRLTCEPRRLLQLVTQGPSQLKNGQYETPPPSGPDWLERGVHAFLSSSSDSCSCCLQLNHHTYLPTLPNVLATQS